MVPAGRSRDGLQIVTRQYGDYTSLALARLLEQSFHRFEPPPQLK